MNFSVFDIANADFNPFKVTSKDWFLITAGDEKNFNTMTASWGFFGVMWGKNVAQIVVRPQRHTMNFLQENDTFSISVFSENYRNALQYCGSHSGNDVDKVKETNLTPIFLDNTPTFSEANTILICKKMFVQPMQPQSFLDEKTIEAFYPNNDYHVSFVGEIINSYKK